MDTLIVLLLFRFETVTLTVTGTISWAKLFTKTTTRHRVSSFLLFGSDCRNWCLSCRNYL